MTAEWSVGEPVHVVAGDYDYHGRVAAIFPKLKSGEIRYVVEDDRGRLFIHGPKQMKQIHADAAGVDRAAVIEEALERIADWADAYPLDVFPEPDLKWAHEVLKAHGMTIDSISASAARHVVGGIGKIARDALGER